MMASYRPKVLNANGQDALLDIADNLTVAAAPSTDTDATNKLFVDTEIADAKSEITTDYTAAIGVETANRIAADDALQAAIDDEEAARIAADNALQAEIDTISGTGSNNLYVKRSGDSMSGALTLGASAITLGTDGTGVFTGQLSTGALRSFDANETVRIKSGRATGDLFTVWNTATSIDDGTKVATISADGSASFDGALEAASIDGGTY